MPNIKEQAGIKLANVVSEKMDLGSISSKQELQAFGKEVQRTAQTNRFFAELDNVVGSTIIQAGLRVDLP